MAEVAIPRILFADILRLVSELRPPPAVASLGAPMSPAWVHGSPHVEGAALPMLVPSGNLRLEIWSSGGDVGITGNCSAFCSGAHECEIDRLISLELGGSTIRRTCGLNSPTAGSDA